MYGKTLTALVVLLIIAATVVFFSWQISRSSGNTYTNSVHGYSLTYPSNLDVKEYTDDISVLGIVSDSAVDAYVEARVITAQGQAGQTQLDAVADQLKNLCAADGPQASFSCTKTLSTEPFTTEYGDQGYVLMLQGELKDFASSTTEMVAKGPYYVLNISSSATISKALVIAPPLNISAAESDAELIAAVAMTVRFIR